VTGRDRLVIVIVAAVAAVALAWFAVIEPKRSEASKLGDEVKAVQVQLDTARAKVAEATASRISFAKTYTAVAKLGEAVPADDNVPSLIYQLQAAANNSKVDFRSLVLNPASTAPTAVPAPAAALQPATKGAQGTSAATPSNAPQSAAQSVTATLPPGAAVGSAGFPTLPFTFTFQGNFFHLKDFFGRIERFVVATNKRVSVSGRLMSLNAISLGPSKAGFPQITASISATTYLVPQSQGVLSGATPAGPAAATTPPAR
jgi:hypothetical protein